MTELLIVLAMCVVAWLAYARGHNAGQAEIRREYFARLENLRNTWWREQ